MKQEQSTLRQAVILENKGPSFGKIQLQSSSSAKSLRFEIWGQVPWRDWKTAAMRPKTTLGILPKLFTSSKKKERATFYSFSEESTIKSEGERVCGRFWTKHAYGSARETLTQPTWRPWGHRQVLRRWWRPTARCKPDMKPRYTSKNWTHSWRSCFLKKHSQFFHSGSSARISWVSLPLDQRSKKHLIRNYKRIDCHSSNCVPFVVQGLSMSSSTTPTSISSTCCIAGFCIWR